MAEQDILSLSDEDFAKQSVPDFLDTEESNASEQTDESEAMQAEESGDSNAEQEEPEEVIDSEEVSQPEGDTQTEHEPFSDDDNSESLDTKIITKSETDESKSQDTDQFDYENAYKEVTSPFKANGIDMQVNKPADIIKLMQMGANYQKKMAQMKPNLKVIKMLENHGLLDESKINNLIDLSKKDSKAITKLLKDSELDPLDIDTSESVDYQPNNYAVSDNEYELDQALDGIKNTSTFNQTIDVLTKEWDDRSKVSVSNEPNVIGIINEHMSNGVYEKVNAVMQRDKALGKLEGVSDFDAYRQIATHLHQTGVLVDSTDSTVSSESVSNKRDTEVRRKQRKAVAPTKQANAVTTPDTNYLNLSDEEFMQVANI